MALEWLPAEPVNFVEETDNNTATFGCTATPSGNHYAEIIISSSTLPATLVTTVLVENNLPYGIKVSGSTPRIDDVETYYVVARLQEYHYEGANKIIDEYKDAYFTIINNVVNLQWTTLEDITIDDCYENTSFVKNIKDYLIGLNGDEVFRKIEGSLPHSIALNSNGVLTGIPHREDIGTYTFYIAVYRNNEIILDAHKFILIVSAERTDSAPVWITESGLLNTIDAGQSISDIKIIASINYDETTPATDKKITYEIIDGVLPTGLIYTVNSSNQCVISGTVLTTAVKEWPFTMTASRMAGGVVKTSEPRTFSFITNKASKEHEIDWGDSATIDAGSYDVGEVINTSIPLATVTDGSVITYEVIDKDADFPKTVNIGSDGSLTGVIEYPTSDEGFKTYSCVVKASTPYTYLNKVVQITILRGLGYNALNLSLRINLEYKDQFNEIRNQLNTSALFGNGSESYNIDAFPKIDVATLTCFDRELLAGIFNFGTPEVIRFLETRYKTYSDMDVNGNPTETYEVYYKPVDEAYYQWDEIDVGPYDFEYELEKEKTITEEFGDKTTTKPFNLMDKEAKLEFNNRTNEPDPLIVVDWVEDEASTEEQKLYKIGRKSAMVGYDIFNVFNFKNVREMLQQPIYVYKKLGDYYYDMGNQQLFEKNNITTKKLYFIEEDDEYSNLVEKYFISNEDGTGEESVEYKEHLVYKNDVLMTDVLFKPEFDTHPFMIKTVDEENEIYNIEEITDPWCLDRTRTTWISLDKVPDGEEMVLPRISDTDVIDNDHIILLDVSREPLPKWKRKEAIYWEASTTYNVGDILYYNSNYYLVIKKFTSDFGFEYNQEYMRLLTNEEVKEQLFKQFIPSLDLGYYKPGKNRVYLNKLNEEEKKGNFWYRKDFFFWEVVCNPVYNQSIETFGVPFYSTENKSEQEGSHGKKTYELIVNTPNHTATLTVNGVNIITASEDIKDRYRYEHVGNSYKITVDYYTFVGWSASAGDDYYPQSGNYIVINDIVNEVTLEKKITLTIDPTPADAEVTLNAIGYTQSGNSISVPERTLITYSVTKDGYIPVLNQRYYAVNSETLHIALTKLYTLTVVPEPDIGTANITITADGYEQQGNSISVPFNTPVHISITCEGFFDKDLDMNVTQTETLVVPIESTTYTYDLVDEENNQLISEQSDTLTSEVYPKT